MKPRLLSPDAMRSRLSGFLLEEKQRAKEAGDRPRHTAASLGRALGNKDHIRDFLIGKKESLSVEAIVEAERLLNLRHGTLHLAQPIVGSFDPDAPETADPDSAPAVFFPPDAIKELAAKGGMGAGQTIATTYVRDGQEIVQRDAVLDDYWRLPPDFVRSVLGARPVDLLVMKGQGDSMEPTIMSGEPVIVNTSHKLPSPDGLYAIRDQVGEVVIKRLELFGVDPPRVRIISDNKNHSSQERGLDEIQIVGKVVIGLKLF